MINGFFLFNDIDNNDDNSMFNSYLDEKGNPLNLLIGFNHINIFIGENNSGKSRLMRGLLKLDFSNYLSDACSKNDNDQIESIKANIKTYCNKLQGIHPSIVLHKHHDELTPCELFEYYTKESKKIDSQKLLDDNWRTYSCLKSDLFDVYKLVEMSDYGITGSGEAISKLYIPVLRGVENFNLYFSHDYDKRIDSISMNEVQREAIIGSKSNANSIYKNKVSEVYELDKDIVFTGEDLYSEIRDKLLGNKNDRKFISDFQDFISANFYNGEGFTIIPIIKKRYLNVKIGVGEEHALHDLGDGIKQMICILYKVFEYRDREALVCIEEPEINMHPGFQRKLIEILQKDEFSKHTYVITTHSNHLVDSSFDYDTISLFKFIIDKEQKDRFKVIRTTPNDIQVLNLLGVNNSSVFMSNSTIWVEGLSDKIYLSRYMQVYMKSEGKEQYKEGIDYSFVEYGGNNVVHWSFSDEDAEDKIKASGIANRIFLIADNDNDSKGKKRRKDELRSVLGNRFYELDVREIENTISLSVLEKTLFENKEIQYKSRPTKSGGYANKSTRIWVYIDKHYLLNREYWDDSRNVPRRNKVEFAKNVCKNINSIEDLSETAIDICEKMYNFISNKSEETNAKKS